MTLSSSRLDLRRWLDSKTGGEKEIPLQLFVVRCKNDCCVWWILGPPKTRDGSPSPLYEFQQKIIANLEQYKRLGIVKARGLGMTELALKYGLFLALSKQIA